MQLTVAEQRIPGKILEKSAMGNVTGLEFLQKIFYISRGIMLSQIREISGIDGSTLQNWTKRGWVANSIFKKYDIEQMARILIINMLRDCMQLDRIVFLLRYLNGEPGDNAAIISEAQLYDYLCRIIESLEAEPAGGIDLRARIEAELCDYVEPCGGAKLRIVRALEIMLLAYYAASLKKQADARVQALMQPMHAQKGE